MKKTLVAIAALAVVGVQAQTSVVLDGYIDRGYAQTSNSLAAKNAKVIGSNAGTTTFGIKVREELSKDLTVGMSVNTDWADVAGMSQDSATFQNTTTQSGGFANSQSFADLTSKSMGTLRLGSPNNFTLTNATGVASPSFSTGIGSAYSSSYSIANGVGTGSTGSAGIANVSTSVTTANSVANAGQRAIRIANTIQYSSPVMNGASVHFGKSLKNNNNSTLSTVDTVGVTEYALRYTNGPVDAMYTTVKYETPTLATLNTTALATTSTQNLLGASYAIMPTLKLHAGTGTFTSTSDTYKGTSNQMGVTFTSGSFTLMGQASSVDDKSTTNMDRKMTGVGVDYALSKTARAYYRFDSINYNTNQATATAEGTTQKRTAIGFSKSF
jgi:predicted porin